MALTLGPVTKQRIGRVGVDSGELILIDPCYIDGPIDISDANGRMGPSRTHPQGITFPSGLGDGTYDVYAYEGEVTTEDGRSLGKRIAKVEVVFLGENQDS